MAPDCFKIGYISRVHGVAGEVEMQFTDDIFDRVNADYLFLKMDGLLVPFFITCYRFKNNEEALIGFDDIDTVEAAKELCGAEVWFPKELAAQAEPGEALSWRVLTGFEVNDTAAGRLGEVVHVDDSSQNILLTVRRKDGTEVLLPFHPELVTLLDETDRTLTLSLPEGLLELND